MEELVLDVELDAAAATLIDLQQVATAEVICRESIVLCGSAWVEACYRQIDSSIICEWLFKDGDRIEADHVCLRLKGPARSILIGERAALGWLKTLSAMATQTRAYAKQLKGSQCVLLGAQESIPGLRAASQYAVRCGGGENHPVDALGGLYIQKNHIIGCGSVLQAVKMARQRRAGKLIEVEVGSLNELAEALKASTDMVMLSNFNLRDIQKAVELTQNQVKLEVSGDFELDTMKELVGTGVDYISLAALTMHVRATEFSMQLVSVGAAENSACP